MAEGEGDNHGAVAGLVVHAVVFVAVNLLLIAVWALFSPDGSFSAVPSLLANPSQAKEAAFFPIYVLVFWGAGLLIHAGVVAAGAPGRIRARRAARQAAKARQARQADLVGALGDVVLGGAAVAGIRLLEGDQAAAKVKKAADKKKRKKAKKAQAARDRSRGVPDTSTTTGKTTGTTKATSDGTTGTTERRRGAGVSAADDGQPAKFGRRASDRVTARQWVAVMFTDLVDSTPLNEAHGDEQWAEWLLEHRTLVRECIGRHRGVEVGTQGDGFLVRFELPDDAAGCAIDLQRAMAGLRADGCSDLHLRIGVHAGEVVHNDEDLVGRVINLASRVTDAASADEILVTEPFADHLSPGHSLRDRGLRELKGFDQPRHLLALTWNEAADEITL